MSNEPSLLYASVEMSVECQERNTIGPGVADENETEEAGLDR